MKWIFGLLLILCIGLFVFMQWGSALTGAGKYSQSPGDLNAEKIKLAAMPAGKEASASAVQPVPQPTSPVEALGASAPSPAGVIAHVPASAPTPVSAPQPAVAAPIPVSKPVPPAVPVPVAAVRPVAKACMEWGEFSGSDLQRATQALAAMKLGDQLSTRNVEYASGYWVYIPPLANKSAVNKKIAEIKELGVEDYFVMRESRKWNNAISLGIFKTEEAAKKYLALMKKKGVRSAQLGERKHKLKFTVFILKQADTEQSARMAALQKEYVNSELKPVPCNK
jgi:SPOR domain